MFTRADVWFVNARDDPTSVEETNGYFSLKLMKSLWTWHNVVRLSVGYRQPFVSSLRPSGNVKTPPSANLIDLCAPDLRGDLNNVTIDCFFLIEKCAAKCEQIHAWTQSNKWQVPFLEIFSSFCCLTFHNNWDFWTVWQIKRGKKTLKCLLLSLRWTFF